jgi:hypothetical protein
MNVSSVFFFDKKTITHKHFEHAKTLISRFYLSGVVSSNVTSSYWMNYRDTQTVQISANRIQAQGFGFGDYQNTDTLRFRDKVINFPIHLASRLQMRRLEPELRMSIESLASSTKRSLNPDFLRLAKIVRTLKNETMMEGSKKIAIIGDGYGTLGSLISLMYPSHTIIHINLGRQLVFDFLFSVKAHQHREHKVISHLSEVKDNGFYYIPSEDLEVANGDLDIFISSASFQEMDMEVIEMYFKVMRAQSNDPYLYSANRVSKTLPDGSKINLKNYPWSQDDKVTVKRLPNWLNWGVRRRPPYVFRMDGKVEELLIQLKRKN